MADHISDFDGDGVVVTFGCETSMGNGGPKLHVTLNCGNVAVNLILNAHDIGEFGKHFEDARKVTLDRFVKASRG